MGKPKADDDESVKPESLLPYLLRLIRLNPAQVTKEIIALPAVDLGVTRDELADGLEALAREIDAFARRIRAGTVNT